MPVIKVHCLLFMISESITQMYSSTLLKSTILHPFPMHYTFSTTTNYVAIVVRGGHNDFVWGIGKMAIHFDQH